MSNQTTDDEVNDDDMPAGRLPERPLPFEKSYRPGLFETALTQAMIDSGIVKIPPPPSNEAN